MAARSINVMYQYYLVSTCIIICIRLQAHIHVSVSDLHWYSKVSAIVHREKSGFHVRYSFSISNEFWPNKRAFSSSTNVVRVVVMQTLHYNAAIGAQESGVLLAVTKRIGSASTPLYDVIRWKFNERAMSKELSKIKARNMTGHSVSIWSNKISVCPECGLAWFCWCTQCVTQSDIVFPLGSAYLPLKLYFSTPKLPADIDIVQTRMASDCPESMFIPQTSCSISLSAL